MAEDIYEVDQIIGRRVTAKGKEDYLVRWQNYSPLLSTWEPIDNFSDCQAAVRDFYDRNWPIPGSQATEVFHVEGKPNQLQVKQELLTLQDLPARKGRKLLRGLRKDLKDEILRLQVEKVTQENTPSPLNVNKNSNMNTKFNHESPKRIVKELVKDIPDAKKMRGKRLPGVNEGNEKATKIPKQTTPSPMSKYFYLRSEKAGHKESKKSPFTSKKVLQKDFNLRRSKSLPIPNGVISPRTKAQKESPSVYNLPSRITRQSLPSCSTTCVLEEELLVKHENGCMYIKFCNESKKNVINLQMCEKIISSLHDANKDDVSVVVFIGSGSCFTYGWDLDLFKEAYQGDKQHLLQKYKLMIRLLVTCPKLLVAAVNGPAVGFGVSLASLCDIVFADNQACFETKFAEWGHPPVGCCTYTLPNLIGSAQTMSLLLLNNKLSAKHALQHGLVTEILETDFSEQLITNLRRLCTIPDKCLQDTKYLLHNSKVQELANVNQEECDFFLKYITHDNTMNNIITRWRATIEK